MQAPWSQWQTAHMRAAEKRPYMIPRISCTQSVALRERGFVFSETLVGALGHLDEVVAELRLYGSVNDADFLVETDVVELLDHLSGTELAELPTTAARGTRGVLTSHLGEVRTFGDLKLDLFGLFG
jgi:hypothetical protein